MEPRTLRAFVLILFLAVFGFAGFHGQDGVTAVPATVPGATLFLSPTGSDAGSCTRTAPCRSFDRAYRRASPGEVVEVAAGTYPDQLIRLDESKTSDADVVFVAARNARIAVGKLQLGERPRHSAPSHLTIDGQGRMTTGAIDVHYVKDVRAVDLTFKNLDIAENQGVYARGVDRFTLDGVEIGPICCSSDGLQITNGGSSAVPASNIVLNRLFVHDVVRVCAAYAKWSNGCPDTDDPDAHVDGLQMGAGENVTITNSRWYNIATQEIFLNCLNGGRFSNIAIQNNMIADATGGGSDLNLSDTCDDQFTGFVRIAYNSIEGSMAPRRDGITPETRVEIIGNLIGTHSCQRGYVYKHNVANVACDRTDRVGRPSYVSRDDAAPDLHLARGSLGIDRGDPTSHPLIDIDGQRRPRRVAPDAGADQREPTRIVAGRSIGFLRLGMRKADVETYYGPARLRPSALKGLRLRTASYRAHGGRLSVWYGPRDAVVGLGTTSAYYETRNGLGARVNVASTSVARLPWDTCRRAYKLRGPSADTYFTPVNGRGGKTLSSVSVLKRPYATC